MANKQVSSYSAVIFLLVVVLPGCGGNVPFMGAESDFVRADDTVIQGAVSDPRRPGLDTARDADRKPAEVLTFLGLNAGETVLDLFAGGGYYSEILSRIVGSDGLVYTHNNAGYRKFLGDRDAPRYANNRLPNVVRLEQEIDDLNLAGESIDTALLMLSYHDLYYRPANTADWAPIDGPKMLAALYAALKPGGVLGVVDHAGARRMDDSTISELHRIPEQRAIDEIEAAGFELDAKSDVLENKDDDPTLSVFDARIRGKTDRFVLRFRKPSLASN